MSDILSATVERISKYFLENNIPHFRVKEQPLNHLTKFIFPGGYLTFVSKNIINNSRSSADRFYNSLDEIIRNLPGDIKIYLMIYGMENISRESDEYKELYNQFDDEFGFDAGIELITDINQITIADYPFVIEMPHILRALKVNPIYDVLKERHIVCDNYAYQRFLAVSGDEDIELLRSKYDFEILDSDELNKKYPFRLSFSFKKTTEPNYYRFIYCLEGQIRNIEKIEKPNKVIDGVSHLCKKCHEFFFVRKGECLGERDVCFKCAAK